MPDKKAKSPETVWNHHCLDNTKVCLYSAGDERTFILEGRGDVVIKTDGNSLVEWGHRAHVN